MLWTELKNIYHPKALNTGLLKCTGKWFIMPYAGFCVFGSNLNFHAMPEKLRLRRDKISI